MDFVVKNTTKIGWLDVVCPYFCMGCGRLGAVICECCKNDIKRDCGVGREELKRKVEEGLRVAGRGFRAAEAGVEGAQAREVGVGAGENLKGVGGAVEEVGRGNLRGGVEELWAVGERKGLLEELVKSYKYAPVRGVGRVLAGMLAEAIPCCGEDAFRGEEGVGQGFGCEAGLGRISMDRAGLFPGGEVVVVPLPTVKKHIRERGFDHTLIMARELAKIRGWKCVRMLARANKTVQVGASAEARQKQAEGAYTAAERAKSGVNYLLVDDAWTTGASMMAAARVMRVAGAERVYGVVVAVGR